MFDWILGYVNRWAGRIEAGIIDLVHWGLHALAGVVYAVFGNVGRAWGQVWLSLVWLGKQTTGFAAELVAWIKQIITVDLPALWNTLLADVKGIIAYAERLYNAAVAAVEALGRYVDSLVNAALRWVADNVWAPLKAYADQIWNDLLKWGYQAWQLLNDPAKLATLLLGALIAAAESAFWSIAPPAGRFILGVLLYNGQKLASLLETILTAVL